MFIEYDIEALKMIPTIQVVGLLGIKYNQKKQAICPAHNDTHFGSCIIFEHNMHCYACGFHEDNLGLIAHCYNLNLMSDFQKVCEILANLTGDPEAFMLKGTNNNTILPHSKKLLNFIGLDTKPHRIQLIKNGIDFSNWDEEKFFIPNGECKEYEFYDPSPKSNKPQLIKWGKPKTMSIYKLYEDDPEAYFFLVKDCSEYALRKPNITKKAKKMLCSVIAECNKKISSL